ncbi:MAG: hypothetical protein JW904_05330 [Spirochaetales bacterium]|nr:hypothetical protein [Spirochaetales bacterium]
MEANNKKLVHEYSVRPSECDYRGLLSVVSLCAMLQDTAGIHADKLGVGVGRLLGKNLTWMLSRFRLVVKKQADCRDAVTITTWPSGKEKLFTFREFELRDEKGNMIAQAETAWLIYDLAARCLVRPFLYLEEQYLHERIFSEPMCKIALPVGFFNENDLPVRKGQIDINQHANNLAYIEWITESVPENIFFSSECCGIELNYLSEVLISDKCVSRCMESADTPGVFFHQIVKKESGSEVCRAVSRWKPFASKYSALF